MQRHENNGRSLQSEAQADRLLQVGAGDSLLVHARLVLAVLRRDPGRQILHARIILRDRVDIIGSDDDTDSLVGGNAVVLIRDGVWNHFQMDGRIWARGMVFEFELC